MINNSFDNWLRKSLDGYRPTTASSARDRFLADAGLNRGAKGSRWYYYIFGSLLILGVACLLYYQTQQPVVTPSQVETTSPASEIVNSTESASSTGVAASTKTTSSTETASSAQRSATAVPVSLKESVPALSVSSVKSSLSTESAPVREAEPALQDDITSSDGLISEINSGSFDDDLNKLTEVYDTAHLEHNMPVRVSDNDTLLQKPQPVKEKYNRFHNSSVSIFYRPEILWNIIDNEKLAHNIGLDWNTRLFNGRYLIGTGFGFSLTKGYYEYSIEYKEYLGNYSKLDSVKFVWDPSRFSMEQTVYTTREEVFDTAITTDYARVYRKFVYLQLPLTMGYDMISTGKTTLGLRFIPVLSVLLSKKPVDFRYETGQNRLVQINRITPDRVKTNWQLNAGLCYGRRLTESLWLELEPRFTYYFNSVYEKSDNSSSPMGASIRVAVGIKY